jgi:hypothetical protein
VTRGARAGKSEEREVLGWRAEGRRRQSRVRYEVTSVVKRNSRVFRRFGRRRGVFEKLKSSLKTCQRSGAWAKIGCKQIEDCARASYPGLVFDFVSIKSRKEDNELIEEGDG